MIADFADWIHLIACEINQKNPRALISRNAAIRNISYREVKLIEISPLHTIRKYRSENHKGEAFRDHIASFCEPVDLVKFSKLHSV